MNYFLEKYGITTPERIRHFLAQSAKETNRGESLTEQDYGDKNYFSQWDYDEGRGNNAPEDGEKFRGTGYIHLTGKNQYQEFQDYLKDRYGVDDPDIVRQGADYVAQNYPWLAAGYWWEKNHMNDLVDGLKGKNPDEAVNKVTNVVNYYDQDSRPERVQNYKDLLGIIPD